MVSTPRRDLIAVRSHRIRLMLHGSGWLMVCLGIPWSVGFAAQGLWFLAVLDLLLALCGAIVVRSVRRDRLRLGAAVFVAYGYLFVCAVGLFMDVPDGTHPRSIHVFLLAMAFASYLVLQLEHRLLYFGVPALCMLTFLVLASSGIGIPLYPIPEEHREISAWFNNFSALACLFVVMVLMHADIRVRTALEAELHAGLENRQLEIHYQPQVDQAGRVLGAEALVRWKHPVRGMVPPGEFIALAEQCGLIAEVGRVVLGSACRQLVDWAQRPERAHLTLSVNVSASQLYEPRFIEATLAVLDRTGADPHRLKLELTETMLVHDVEEVMAKMAALRERGIRISLDDFGTGYSSLAYLKRLPLDQLKIDKSFVDNVLTDANDAAIARTVVSLGQNLGLQVIAEGVETEAQRRFLQDIGCLVYQGYLYSKPLPAAELEQFLRRREAGPGVATAPLPLVPAAPDGVPAVPRSSA
ncbi:putative bifunctional diguanylate cyclase/phosphodiesterase [Pseudorhodoferax sp.]|uniref:putative bifunctional diguanylate cyclase/phosphodiesterase n=1 Tax=Pseudorhodoferax sp. TaxID=1993553 RepID=UPI003FA6A999